MDYQQGKIYKLVPKNPLDGDDLCYVGSTCMPRLSKRLSQHKTDYRRWNKGTRGYTSSFALFAKYGINECQILLLESYPCKNKDELRAKEEEWRLKLPVVNKYRAYLDDDSRKQLEKKCRQEYYQKNKDIINAKGKVYYLTNKDEIKERNKEYYLNNIDEIKRRGKDYRLKNSEKISQQKREFRLNNIEKVKQWDRNKYLKHIDKIRERNTMKIVCECGRTVSRSYLTAHKKTNTHKVNLPKEPTEIIFLE